MNVTPIFHEAKPVFIAPVNERASHWGVYAIPWMWRAPNGSIYICVNGTPDNADIGYGVSEHDLIFVSKDGGESFERISNKDVTVPAFTGVEPPYYRLSDGRLISVCLCPDNLPIESVEPCKVFPSVNGEFLYYTYRLGDIPVSSRALEMEEYSPEGTLLKRDPLSIDFPTLEISVFGAAKVTDGKATLVDEYIPMKSQRFEAYYSIHALCELSNGTILACARGQAKSVSDRVYDMVYCLASEDGGKTFRYRADITAPTDAPKFGYSYENSLTLAPNGDLLVVMRTEHCAELHIEPSTDAMFSRSTDGGFTWSTPVAIADSCVTPHLITLKNGVIVFVYGRPGIHMKYSTDSGKTWSEPITLIGKTLSEHYAAGDAYMDCKFWNMDTYANTFVEVLSDDTFLICYTDMKYQTGDGLDHRTTLVRKITFKKED